jgi:hypothetical protein
MPSTAGPRLVIGILTLLKIAKYFPIIAFTIASFSLVLAILDFAVWANWGFGIVNTILAVGGFILTGQLLQRRVTRKEYVRERRPIARTEHEVEPRMNVVYKQSFKEQEAA